MSSDAGIGRRCGIGKGGIVLVAISLGGLTTCTQEKRETAANVSPVAPHAVRSAELKHLMTEIDQRRWQSWPQEVEADYASARRARSERAFARAEELTTALMRAVDQIAQAADHAAMSKSDRRAFLAEVGVFREQLGRLEKVVVAHDADGMRRTLSEIDTTCNSCHERFRDVSGPLH